MGRWAAKLDPAECSGHRRPRESAATKMAKRQWTVWMPGAIHLGGSDPIECGHGPRGRVYLPVDRLSGLSRAEAEGVARARHGNECIVTRRRGEPPRFAYLPDLIGPEGLVPRDADSLRSLGATEEEIRLVGVKDAHERQYLIDGACQCGGDGHCDGLSRWALLTRLRNRGQGEATSDDPWAVHAALGLVP